MTELEANEFIERMEEIGDEWTVDQVMDSYKDKTLQEALDDRMASNSIYFDILSKIAKIKE